ncbi:hypothetical protein QQ045_014886 [Rhodiola kirilowii]
MPSSFKQSKKLVADLGMGYQWIVVCVSGCMIYYGCDESMTVQRFCSEPGYHPPRCVETSSSYQRHAREMTCIAWFTLRATNLRSILIGAIPTLHPRHKRLDIYLRPLIDDLVHLWSVGVDTYDANRKQSFTLRAALMWTVSDFPAYAMLLEWSTQGKLECPYCHEFYDRVRYLKYIWEQGINEVFDGYGVDHNWTKKSIFWELPYWVDVKLRDNLDIMHIEKNVLENLFNTIMDVNGKTKHDGVKCRKDIGLYYRRPELELKTIRSHLVANKVSEVS